MSNLLHELANRGTGFVWPRFPVDHVFPEARLPGYAQDLHNFMKLSDTTTDYWVLGAVHSLLSSPWVLEDAGDPETLREVVFYPQPRTGWVGATLTSSSKGVAAFARVPTTWPLVLKVVISYLDESNARIVCGDQRWDVHAKLSPAGYVLIDWPEEFHAAGVLEVGGTWVEGSTVEIHSQPTSFPYDEAIEFLAAQRSTNRLLLESGLATAWQGARSSIEKYGLLTLGLIKTYRSAC